MAKSTDYGSPTECEVDGCANTRACPDKSVMVYGCVLCVSCENDYQLGRISLPDAEDRERSRDAERRILG